MEEKLQQETVNVTISHSVSKPQKNETPVPHVTKTTPKASLKNLIDSEKSVLPVKLSFSEGSKRNSKTKLHKKSSKLTIPSSEVHIHEA